MLTNPYFIRNLNFCIRDNSLKNEPPEENSIPDSKYFSYEDTSVINEVTIKEKDKCVVYLQNNWSEEDANILCSGNVLDNGVTLKNNVMFGYISKEDYKNAELEVTYVDGISITGYNVEGGLDVVIPSMINGKKVIEIGDYAFTHSGIIPKTISNAKKVSASYLYSSGNKAIITPLQGITSVVIPNTVKSIGYMAFYKNQLTSITFPTTSFRMHCYAFDKNPIIDDETFAYPNNVTSESV